MLTNLCPEQLSEALVPLVDTWLAQIRAGWERGPDHLASVQRELGVMPSLPEARAVWVAALINPLPGLGESSIVLLSHSGLIQ